MRKVAHKRLTELGYRVTEASRGDHALSLLRNGKTNSGLLVTDVVLPGMNGRELAEEARKIIPGLPVLYETGHTCEVIAKRGVDQESLKLIHQPYCSTTLNKKIRTVLDRQQP